MSQKTKQKIGLKIIIATCDTNGKLSADCWTYVGNKNELKQKKNYCKHFFFIYKTNNVFFVWKYNFCFNKQSSFIYFFWDDETKVDKVREEFDWFIDEQFNSNTFKGGKINFLQNFVLGNWWYMRLGKEQEFVINTAYQI